MKIYSFENILDIQLQLENGNQDQAIESAISLMTGGASDAWESDKWVKAIELVKGKYQTQLENWA